MSTPGVRKQVSAFALSAIGAALATAVACGGSGGSSAGDTPGGGAGTSSGSSGASSGASSGSSGASSGSSGASSGSSGASSGTPPSDGGSDAQGDATTTIDPSVIASASCTGAVPAGAPTSLALPVYAGACPALAAPPATTTLASGGAQREFLVFRPTVMVPGEKLPVVFLYHWLGGDAPTMASKLEVQTAVDARRFIGVVPSAKGDVLFRWPFEASQSQSRVEEEAKFFDDMLACVGAALPVNKECVSSVGVSAGALWTAQLATLRSQRLASIVSLSGGVGGIVRGWTTTPHRLPALVLWGGPTDMYPANIPVMNFETASKKLIGALTTDGHYLVECTHNCGHAVPPFDLPPPGGLQFDAVWRFTLDHPYWLGASQSPYTGKPLPAAYPSWCGQGQGSAVPRTDACP